MADDGSTLSHTHHCCAEPEDFKDRSLVLDPELFNDNRFLWDGDVGCDFVGSPRYVGDDGGDLVDSRRGGGRSGDTVDSLGDVGGDVLDLCRVDEFLSLRDSREDNGVDLDFSRRSFNFFEDPRIGVAADSPGEIGH